jgi:hypothetical protein
MNEQETFGNQDLSPHNVDGGRTIVVLAAVVTLAVGFVLIFVAWHRDPTPVDIQTLWTVPEDYDGTLVKVDGTVRVFLVGTDNQHYAVEDEHQYRVGLQGISRSDLNRLVSTRVTVDGTLRITDHGIMIDVRHIKPIRTR